MFQTDQATASSTLPTPATAGTQGFFTNGNPASGVAATIVDADWLNMVQEELVNVVLGGGIALSKTTYNQVLQAIKRICQNTTLLVDTGAANAYSATNAVPLVTGTWVDGVVQAVKIAHANTGTSTYAPDGLTAIPIYGLGLQPLQGGELVAGGTAILMHATITGVNSGNPICVLMECAGGAQQVAPATASQHAVQLGQLTSVGINPGRLLRTSVYYNNAGTLYMSVNGGAFVAAGSSNFATLADTQGVDIECQGAGAGSGGVAASGSSQYGASSSGQGGAYCRGYFAASSVNGALITCGAAGAAGAAGNNNGGNGGTSSVGALLTAPGGIASQGSGVTSSTSNFISPQTSTTQAAPTGTYYLGIPCSGGDMSIGLTATIGLRVAPGGNTPLGSGGQTRASSGNNGNGFGAGASGAGIGVSTAAQAGFAGAPGAVIFREYA